MKSSPAVPTTSERPKTLELKHSLALRMRLARSDAGVEQQDVADEAGTNAPSACRWEQGDEEQLAPNALHLARMRGKARPVALAVADWIREQVGAPAPSRVVHGNDHRARLSIVTRECTDAPRVLAAALEDDLLTDDELEMIALESKQAAEAALELDAWAVEELLRRRGPR